jgi:hypothetical protein
MFQLVNVTIPSGYLRLAKTGYHVYSSVGIIWLRVRDKALKGISHTSRFFVIPELSDAAVTRWFNLETLFYHQSYSSAGTHP